MQEGERVPFDRVLGRHLEATEQLRARGLTWIALARILGRAGIRRADGKQYSADHLRVSFARLQRDSRGAIAAGAADHSAAFNSRDQAPATATRGKAAKTPAAAAAPSPTRAERRAARPMKDVSQDEIILAAARLKRLEK